MDNGYNGYSPQPGSQQPRQQSADAAKALRIVGIAIGAGMILFGVIFIGVSMVIEYFFNESRERCTEKVSAVVVDLVHNSNNGFDSDGTYHSDRDSDGTVAPVFCFGVGEEVYTVQTNTYSYPPKHEINDVVDIYYDPDDPNVVYDPAFSEDRTMFIVFCVIGGIACAAGLAVIVVVLVSIHKSRHRDELEDYYSR